MSITDNSKNERVFINLIRGLAVFLMLWGHCIQWSSLGEFDFFENSVFRIIYSFHMPLFMLISGYLFFFSMKKRNLKELLKHQVQARLQPIIMCGILCFLLWEVVVQMRLGNYLAIFGGGWIHHLTDYWFLWSVLASSIAAGIAVKVNSKTWVSAILLILGVPFVCMMPCAEMNVFMYPYFVIGYLYSALKDKGSLKRIEFLKYFSLPLFPVMMLFFKREHYIYTSGLRGNEGLFRHMPVNLYRWAIGLVGSVFAVVLLELLCKLFRGRLDKSKAVALFGKLGEKSLQVYVLSCIFLSRYWPVMWQKAVNLIGRNPFIENMIVYNYVFTLLLAVLFSAGLLLMTYLLEKAKVSRILFGK